MSFIQNTLLIGSSTGQTVIGGKNETDPLILTNNRIDGYGVVIDQDGKVSINTPSYESLINSDSVVTTRKYVDTSVNTATSTGILQMGTSTGFVVQSGDDSFVKRTIYGTADLIDVTNGNGVNGNIVINVGSNVATLDSLNNVQIGNSLYSNSVGYGNIALGSDSMYHNVSGCCNIAIGCCAGSALTTCSNTIVLGNIAGTNVSNATYIDNIYGSTCTCLPNVYIGSDDRLYQSNNTYGADTKLFTGIPWDERGKFKVAFTYSAPNLIATISFVGANTSFSYYINSQKFTVTSTGLSAYTKIATAAEGVWYFYISSSTTNVLSPVITLSQTAWTIYNPDVLLWNAYFNASSGTITWVGEERHTAGRDIFQHARNHAQGALYKNGFGFSQYNGLTTLSSNTDNNFGRAMAQIAGGSFYDEDILNTITHTDASITSTNDSPANDWNLTVNQFLGFTDITTTGTNSTTIVFTTSRTLNTGQAVAVMTGNTTTIRGTTTITTGGTGTSFTVTSVTGLASGDAIVISGRFPIYFISSVVGSTYTWRKLQATSFAGATTQAATWTRSSATITVTFTNHGLQTNDYIFVTVSSDTGAIPLGKYTVTRTGANTFTFTGVATGGTSGTLTYNNAFNSTTIATGVAQYNDTASGGFLPVTSTRYFPIYLAATNFISEPVIAILGQGQSSNSTLATALGETSFQFQNLVGLSGLGIQEIVPFYRLTFSYNSTASYNANRMRLMDATYLNLRVATVTGTVIGGGTSIVAASSVYTDTTNFNGKLSTSNTTAQSALDTLDDHNHNLSDLSDVNSATKADGRYLQWNTSTGKHIYSTAASGSLSTRTITSTGTATITDGAIVLNGSTTSYTVTLPAVSTATGVLLRFKQIGTGIVTIDANSSELIDGQLTQVLQNQYEAMEIFCDGSAWYIL